MRWSTDPGDQKNLVQAVNSAVSNALCNSTDSEPQIVANLVWELPRAINRIVSSGGWTLQSGGVFVHAQPFVKCNNFPDISPSSVEIGDLLLLRTEVRGEQVSNRRALLLQAKKATGFPARPDNTNQLHLYNSWPSFEYVRSTKFLNGKKRHITGLDLYDASRFLLISDHGCCHPSQPRFCHLSCHSQCCTLTASPTNPELSHYRCFISELIDFLLGDAGKAFDSPPPSRTRKWDRVIEDLRLVTAKQRSTFVGRAAGTMTGERGQGHVLFFLSGAQPATHGILRSLWMGESYMSENMNDGPPQVPANWSGEDSESGGISMIEFIITNEAKAE